MPGAFKMAAAGTMGLIKYFRKGDFLKAPGTTLAQILKGKAPSYIPGRIARLGASIGSRTPPRCSTPSPARTASPLSPARPGRGRPTSSRSARTPTR
ncbi:hypothetical protein NQP46_05905 [Streptomyces albus]|nr:hypothetical protein NQP46_05905 [Streptomyces albus]